MGGYVFIKLCKGAAERGTVFLSCMILVEMLSGLLNMAAPGVMHVPATVKQSAGVRIFAWLASVGNESFKLINLIY